jgi:hypothetical protein
MTIENISSFDYSTTDKIDWTLQDKIDELHLSTKKSLKDLSSEVFSNLKTLTVDTLNTRLNVRDIDWVVIWKLNDWSKISFLNDSIEKNGKIFVKVLQPNGEPGYVSADYVRADAFDYAVTPSIKDNTNKKEENKEVVTKSKIEKEKLLSEVKKDNDSDKKITLPEVKTEKIKHNQINNHRTIYERWSDSITETSHTKLSNFEELLKAHPEKATDLKNNYEKYILLSEVFLPIWKQTALQKAQWESMQWLWWMAHDWDEIKDNLEKINSIDLLSTFISWNTWTLNTNIQNIKWLIQEAEWYDSTWIMDLDDINAIFWLIENSSDSLTVKKNKILNLMRSWAGFESGNSTEVANMLIWDILKDPAFSTLKTSIDNQLSSIDVAKNVVPKKYENMFLSAKTQLNKLAKQTWEDWKPKIALADINPSLDYQIKQSIIMAEMKDFIGLKDLTGLDTNNPLKILGNIFGEGKGSDTFSDNTAEGFTEGAVFIATSLIPWMWVWILGAKLALIAWNGIVKATQISTLVEKGGRLWNLWKWLQWATIIGAEWVWLHAWMMTYDNFLNAKEGKDFLNMWTWADWAKSIAFAGVFRWVNGLITKYGWEGHMFGKLWNLWDDWVYTFNKTSAKIAVTSILDTAWVWAGSFAIDSLFSDDSTEYTWDHILQLAGMSLVARAMGGNRLESWIGWVKQSDTSFKNTTPSDSHTIGLSKPTTKQQKLHEKINAKSEWTIDAKWNKIPSISEQKIPDWVDFIVNSKWNTRVRDNFTTRNEKHSTKEIVDDMTYKSFIDTGEISDEILEKIAKKMYKSQELSLKEQQIRSIKNKEIEVNMQKLLNNSPLGKIKKSSEKNLEKTSDSLKNINNSLKKKNQEINSKENELASIDEQVTNYKPRWKKITDLEKKLEEVKNTYKNKEESGLNYDDRDTFNLWKNAKNWDIIALAEKELSIAVNDAKKVYKTALEKPIKEDLNILKQEKIQLEKEYNWLNEQLIKDQTNLQKATDDFNGKNEKKPAETVEKEVEWKVEDVVDVPKVETSPWKADNSHSWKNKTEESSESTWNKEWKNKQTESTDIKWNNTAKSSKEILVNELTSSETNIFKKLFLDKFKETKSITIENWNWWATTINKQSNGLFTINKNNWPKGKALSENDLLSKIDNVYKVDFIETHNLAQTLKIWKGQDINLLKTYNLPFTGKIKIREWWIVELNWKELEAKYIKKIFKIPRIRQELLEKTYNLDKASISKSISQSSEFISAFDKFASNLPLHLDKLYKIPKWIVYNSQESRMRSIPNAIYNETMVPFRVVKDLANAKNLTLEQNLKNILLTNKDYTIKDGLKRWAAFWIVFPAIETFMIIDDKNDLPDEFYKEALSNVYLWTINSAIYEYITKQNRIEEGTN